MDSCPTNTAQGLAVTPAELDNSAELIGDVHTRDYPGNKLPQSMEDYRIFALSVSSCFRNEAQFQLTGEKNFM